MNNHVVTFYTHGRAETQINFPNGDEACRWCHLYLRYEDAYKRYSCRLTGEWILDPMNERGASCPLAIDKEMK